MQLAREEALAEALTCLVYTADPSSPPTPALGSPSFLCSQGSKKPSYIPLNDVHCTVYPILLSRIAIISLFAYLPAHRLGSLRRTITALLDAQTATHRIRMEADEYSASDRCCLQTVLSWIGVPLERWVSVERSALHKERHSMQYPVRLAPGARYNTVRRYVDVAYTRSALKNENVQILFLPHISNCLGLQPGLLSDERLLHPGLNLAAETTWRNASEPWIGIFDSDPETIQKTWAAFMKEGFGAENAEAVCRSTLPLQGRSAFAGVVAQRVFLGCTPHQRIVLGLRGGGYDVRHDLNSVVEVPNPEEVEFIVLGSPPLWHLITTEELVEFVRASRFEVDTTIDTYGRTICPLTAAQVSDKVVSRVGSAGPPYRSLLLTKLKRDREQDCSTILYGSSSISQFLRSPENDKRKSEAGLMQCSLQSEAWSFWTTYEAPSETRRSAAGSIPPYEDAVHIEYQAIVDTLCAEVSFRSPTGERPAITILFFPPSLPVLA
eukprot:Sspe_Gene.44304::Locus_21711_Transcript_1_1_Confidence_1.000_Length_1544::g.44304::m.44304